MARVKTKEAASELGITVYDLKERIKEHSQGRLPDFDIGIYTKRSGSSYGSYHIDRGKLDAYKKRQEGGSSASIEETAKEIAKAIAKALLEELKSQIGELKEEMKEGAEPRQAEKRRKDKKEGK